MLISNPLEIEKRDAGLLRYSRGKAAISIIENMAFSNVQQGGGQGSALQLVDRIMVFG